MKPQDVKDKIIVITQEDWFKKGLFILSILLIFTVIGVVSFNIYENKKTKKRKESLEKVEITLQKLNILKSLSDTINVDLDSSKKHIKVLLTDYKNLITTNHYENDSNLTYINNVHIDTLLSRLPEFSGEVDSI